jgi:AhpD family alkylhydroperoxidase
MASELEHVAWESCAVEFRRDRALDSYSRRKMGLPNPALGYFAAVPWLARSLVDLRPECGLLMHLDQEMADLVALGVSQENACRFCYAAVRALLWAQGLSRGRVQHIEQEFTRADLPPRTAAAIAFGRGHSRSGPSGARAAREALFRAGFGPEEMKEIALVVGETDFSNRAHTIPAVPARPLERMPDQLHMRLMRPLLNRLLRRSRQRGEATPLRRVPPYPYIRLVQAYAGSPIGAALGRTIEEMWASPLLTRRCKLLMLAVVARGLSCEVCAQEVGEALRGEGLSQETLARVLTHLDAPELDAVERSLVPFARETIWYEPASIQRRARALREHLSSPQLVEAIGVASLANGLCRMGAMVLEPS